jgi:hypothetical protein
MRVVKYIMMALALVAVILCLVYNVMQYGIHGIAVLVLSLIPLVLGGVSIKMGGMPRWASAVSMVVFLVIGLKTSGDSTDLQNIMVVGFFGLILALALLIIPDKPKEAAPAGGAPPPPAAS